jgi:hypothetical protein
VDLYVDTNVFEKQTGLPEDGDSMFFSETLVSTSPHGVITYKKNIDIFTAVRTSNLAHKNR